MLYWEKLTSLGFSDYLAIFALIISIIALRQTSRFRRQDLALTAHETFVEVSLALKEAPDRCRDLQRQWHAYYAAAGMFDSGRRRQLDGEIETYLGQASDLNGELSLLASSARDFGGRVSVRQKRDIVALQSKVKAFLRKIEGSEAQLAGDRENLRRGRRS